MAGFEDRATAIVDDLSRTRVQHILTVVYPTNLKDNVPGRTKLGQLPVIGTRTEIEYSRFDFVRRMQEWLQPYRHAAGLRVVIDLSGMASYVVYRVLSAVGRRYPRPAGKPRRGRRLLAIGVGME